ncbi:MAG: type II toxin-antitoxin system HicA family toxin [Anaerolineales bacterium]
MAKKRSRDRSRSVASASSSGQRRLRQELEGRKEARVSEVETFLRACGWRARKSKSGHRAWVKEGKRTLIVPVHGTKVREYVIRQILAATI